MFNKHFFDELSIAFTQTRFVVTIAICFLYLPLFSASTSVNHPYFRTLLWFRSMGFTPWPSQTGSAFSFLRRPVFSGWLNVADAGWWRMLDAAGLPSTRKDWRLLHCNANSGGKLVSWLSVTSRTRRLMHRLNVSGNVFSWLWDKFNTSSFSMPHIDGGRSVKWLNDKFSDFRIFSPRGRAAERTTEVHGNETWVARPLATLPGDWSSDTQLNEVEVA